MIAKNKFPGFADFDESKAPDKEKNQFVKAVLDISTLTD